MRKFLKRTIQTLATMVLLNLITFLILGKTALTQRIVEDTHTSYRVFQWTKNVNILSNLGLSRSEVAVLRNLYSDTKADFKYSENYRENEWLLFNDRYYHLLEGELQIQTFTYNIEEWEKMAEYAHGYQRTYLWVLFVWIQIDEKFLGIS